MRKRRAKSPSARVLPRADSDATVSRSVPGEPLPARGRRWLGRRIVTLLALLLLPLLGVTAAVAWRYWAVPQNENPRRELAALTSGNALLNAQQLETLFGHLLERLAQNRELSDRDQAVLTTWLRFDEKFLAENETNPADRFERASVHRRVGQVAVLLKDYARAEAEYGNAIAMLQQLSREQPTVTGFIKENAETHVGLGRALQQAGNFAEAANVYRQAARLMADRRLAQDPGFLPDPNLDPRVLDVCALDSLADLALERGVVAEAVSHQARIVELLRGLTLQYPGVAGYQAALSAAEAKLASTGQQVVQP